MTQARPTYARPFLKWAGGKGQLVPQIDQHLPPILKQGRLQRYVEPFVGSGALFFHVAQHYPVPELVIADINKELILAYRTIQRDVVPLIEALAQIEAHYLALPEASRKAFYYSQREAYNEQRRSISYDTPQDAWIARTAQMIFLNRTCYNGLFRVNASGAFNVPFGRYANPTICDAPNLTAVSAILQRAAIQNRPYSGCAEVIDNETLVYFDPPYRPLSRTAHFTAYSTQPFDDRSQLQLADFYRRMNNRGAYLVLSNSDPAAADPEDDFLEAAYDGFRIERVQARRRINSRADRRGRIPELLILNY